MGGSHVIRGGVTRGGGMKNKEQSLSVRMLLERIKF